VTNVLGFTEFNTQWLMHKLMHKGYRRSWCTNISA